MGKSGSGRKATPHGYYYLIGRASLGWVGMQKIETVSAFSQRLILISYLIFRLMVYQAALSANFLLRFLQ